MRVSTKTLRHLAQSSLLCLTLRMCYLRNTDRVKYVLRQICGKAIFPKMHKSGKLNWTHICAGAENAQIWKTEHLLIWGRLPSCSADSTTWLWIPPSTQNTRNKYFSWVHFQIIRILKSKILSWAYSPRGHLFRNTRKETFSWVYYFLNYTISYYVRWKTAILSHAPTLRHHSACSDSEDHNRPLNTQ